LNSPGNIDSDLPPGSETGRDTPSPWIAEARLRAQRLTSSAFGSASEAVRFMGAVQAQDYAGAKWALALRSAHVTDGSLDRLYDEGAILRTHVLRPTWHFVHPEDVRWLLSLTGPRVQAGAAGRYRELELDRKTITRALTIFERQLSGARSLTRAELGQALVAAHIAPDGQRLPHLLMAAELEGLIVSGPRRGKQHTWALLDERVPHARRLERNEAVTELARRYFHSHGPAQLQDFVWWSGLTLTDARRGVAMAGHGITRRTIDGNEYWFDEELVCDPSDREAAHLLPNFDEYTVSYRDRSAMLHPDFPFRPELFGFSSILSNVVIVGGRVCGSWRRTLIGDGVRVEVRLLGALDASERNRIVLACRSLAGFLERRLELEWSEA